MTIYVIKKRFEDGSTMDYESFPTRDEADKKLDYYKKNISNPSSLKLFSRIIDSKTGKFDPVLDLLV